MLRDCEQRVRHCGWRPRLMQRTEGGLRLIRRQVPIEFHLRGRGSFLRAQPVHGPSPSGRCHSSGKRFLNTAPCAGPAAARAALCWPHAKGETWGFGNALLKARLDVFLHEAIRQPSVRTESVDMFQLRHQGQKLQKRGKQKIISERLRFWRTFVPDTPVKQTLAFVSKTSPVSLLVPHTVWGNTGCDYFF